MLTSDDMNNKLNLPIINANHSDDLMYFISYWSKLYSYGKAEKYNRIFNKELEEKDITKLYEWKNGMNLSVAKAMSLQNKIISKIDIIKKLRSDTNLDINAFLDEFKEVSTVWKIFLLHIINPKVYPIYDQHVHRAFRYITNQPFDGIKSTMYDGKKLKFYFDDYLPFVKGLEIKDLKKMDEAFFAFGQFLNIGHQKLLVE